MALNNPVDDLAGFTSYTRGAPDQMLAGDTPLKTASGVALADLAKYQLGELTATGVRAWVGGTSLAAAAVIVMQPCLSGGACQYAYAGVFNDDFLAAAGTWDSAHATIDTYIERHNFFTGQLRVDKLYASA